MSRPELLCFLEEGASSMTAVNVYRDNSLSIFSSPAMTFPVHVPANEVAHRVDEARGGNEGG